MLSWWHLEMFTVCKFQHLYLYVICILFNMSQTSENVAELSIIY